MYELYKDEIKYLLDEYDINSNKLKLICLSLCKLNFIKTREQFFFICEVACFRYQSSKVDNDYLHSINKRGHIIKIEDVILDALNEVYEEPEDMSYLDREELENYKKSLINTKIRHI